VIGLGLGLVFAPAVNTGTFGVAPYDAGVASATVNVGQQAGGSIGTALLNTMVASAAASYLASHLNPGTILAAHPSAALVQQSFVHGYTVGFWWTADIFAAGAVVYGTLLRRGPLYPWHAPAAAPEPGGCAAGTTVRSAQGSMIRGRIRGRDAAEPEQAGDQPLVQAGR
jgi:hypothetical protein